MKEASRGVKVMLVCSSGGHLLQLQTLRDVVWSRYDHVWVTFKKPDSEYLLRDEQVYWGYFPTNRSLLNLIRNALLAWRLVRKERPTCVVSTGAGIAVPFLLVARGLKIPTVYIESFARVQNLSLTGRLLYPIVDHFFVQARTLTCRYPHAKFKGSVY